MNEVSMNEVNDVKMVLGSVTTDGQKALENAQPQQPMTIKEMKKLRKKMLKSAKRAGIKFRKPITKDKMVGAVKQKLKNRKKNKLASATRRAQKLNRQTSTKGLR